MSSWENKLRKFTKTLVEEKVENIAKTAKSKGVKIDKRSIEQCIYSLLNMVDANQAEPILEINGRQTTPRDYLQVLVNQLRDDIWPLFRVPDVTPGGAPFTILRNTFCYMDYVSSLRFRRKGNMGDVTRLLNDFGPDDMKDRYREYSSYLIQLYRHDLVHLTAPFLKLMRIKNGSKEKVEAVGFSIISDVVGTNREVKRKLLGTDFEAASSLMRSVRFRKNAFFHLRFYNGVPTVNTFSIFFDLVNYIKDYQASLAKEEQLNREFVENHIETVVKYVDKILFNEPLDILANKMIVA